MLWMLCCLGGLIISCLTVANEAYPTALRAFGLFGAFGWYHWFRDTVEAHRSASSK